MPQFEFYPMKQIVEVKSGVKILACAIKHKIPIRYGCGACQCGTCAVSIDQSKGQISAMDIDEQQLLDDMDINIDGSKRLACRAKILEGSVTVDLDFQNNYSPDYRKSENKN